MQGDEGEGSFRAAESMLPGAYDTEMLAQDITVQVTTERPVTSCPVEAALFDHMRSSLAPGIGIIDSHTQHQAALIAGLHARL